MLGNLREFDCTTRLKDITCPTLYTCGRFDEATPESTEYYSRLTRNSTFHVFENSAHMAYIEETEEYLSIMGDFLKSIAFPLKVLYNGYLYNRRICVDN